MPATLSELCARQMLEDPALSAGDRLAVLQSLRRLGKARSEALEREVQQWSAVKASRVAGFRKARRVEQERKERTKKEKELALKRQKELERERKEEQKAEDEQKMKYVVASQAARTRREQLQFVFDWKKKMVGMMHKIHVLEREIGSVLHATKLEDDGIMAELERYHADLEKRREEEAMDLKNLSHKAKRAFERFRASVSEMGSGEAYLRSLRQHITETEGCIGAMKSSQIEVMQSLANSAKNLMADVEHYKGKIEAEDSRLNQQRQRLPRRTIELEESKREEINQVKELHERIEDIDEEIADRGGSTGNWDNRDHTLFLRCVSRNKIHDSVLTQFVLGVGENVTNLKMDSVPSLIRNFVENFTADLPAMSDSEILSHLHWYGNYLLLLREKKKVVKQWKELRSIQSQKRIETIAKEQSDPNSAAKDVNEGKLSAEERRALREEREREREQQRRQVEEWKASKRAQENAQRKAKQAEEQAERRKRSELAKKRQKEKEGIALYKLQKEAEQSRQKRFKETIKKEKQAITRHKSNLSMKERQLRDLVLANKRKELARERNEATQDRASRIQSLKVKPAVRPGFQDKLQTRHGVTEATASFKQKQLTPSELTQLQESRQRTSAHDATVPSASAAAMGGRSYAIGVKNLISGRSAASWKS